MYLGSKKGISSPKRQAPELDFLTPFLLWPMRRGCDSELGCLLDISQFCCGLDSGTLKLSQYRFRALVATGFFRNRSWKKLKMANSSLDITYPNSSAIILPQIPASAASSVSRMVPWLAASGLSRATSNASITSLPMMLLLFACDPKCFTG